MNDAQAIPADARAHSVAAKRASLKVPGDQMRSLFLTSLMAAIIGMPAATAATA
jgi:hypothetical protein